MKPQDTNDANDPLHEVLDRIFVQSGFLRLTLNGPGASPTRLKVRRIRVDDADRFQFETRRGAAAETVLLTESEARHALQRRLRRQFRDLHLITVNGDLHVRRAKRGRLLCSRSRPLKREPESVSAHDRVKTHPLNAFASGPLLRALGFADAEGRLRASMQAKYRQVNAFLDLLRLVVESLPGSAEAPLRLLDGGCGHAYLTLAACVYLRDALHRPVTAIGLDRNPDRIRTSRQLAAALDLSDTVDFLEQDIEGFTPSAPPHIVMCLHACDTATDAVLAGGVRWGAGAILAVPCCQHALHAALRTDSPMRAVLRHGLLRQRQADLLTDTFRAQLLRLAGYRVTLQEFVDPDATTRNLLIRALRGGRPGHAAVLDEYLVLRDFWGVTPPLETLLTPLLDIPERTPA